MKTLASLILLSSLAAAPITAPADTPMVQNPRNKHYYKRFDTSMGWHRARYFCEDKGGYLVTVTTQAEQDFVWTRFGAALPTVGAQGLWLGASDEDSDGRWKWVTGEAWRYSNWAAGEPDDGGGGIPVGEDYGWLRGAAFGPDVQSLWSDVETVNNSAHGYVVYTVCEWNTQPDVYGKIKIHGRSVAGFAVTMKQSGQPDKTVTLGASGKFQLQRNNREAPATVTIDLPTRP
jgi:hypothetical protein